MLIQESLKTWVSVLVAVTVAEMMFSMGLRLGYRELKEAAITEKKLLIRALIINFAGIPAITLILLLVFKVETMTAIGLLILAAAPAAPYALPFTVIARGSLRTSAYQMIILAALSPFLVPLILRLMMLYVPGGNHFIKAGYLRMTATLLIIQLIPLCGGIWVRSRGPKRPERLQNGAGWLSRGLNALMITVIVILQFHILARTAISEALLTILLVATGLTLGWVCGLPKKEDMISLSMITGLRNMSLAMGIALYSFPGTPVITAVLSYSFIAGSMVLAIAWLMRFRRRDHATENGQ